MNKNLIGFKKISPNGKKTVVKRRVYKISDVENFLEKADSFDSITNSLIDIDFVLPPKHISIENIDEWDVIEGFYANYFIVLFDNYSCMDVEVLGFSRVDYPGYDDTLLTMYLQGIISAIWTVKRADSNHNK